MNKKAISMESLFVMILFMMFTISMVLMIISGRTSYTRILDEKEQSEGMRISSSYLRMKLKQNNEQNAISIIRHPELGIDLLEIKHQGEENQYKTIIYYYDSKICEAYLTASDRFEISMGEPVIHLSLDAVRFLSKDKGIEISYVLGEEEVRQFVALQMEE